MEYTQLKQPNLNIVGQDGYCLVYVREVFGVPAKYNTASDAWHNAQYQHTGYPPTGIAVPIWFSWETDGHVAVWDNGTIYSTTAHGDKTFSSIQELVDFIQEGIVYLGWSEDINAVRVVQPQGDEDVATAKQVDDTINGLAIVGYGPGGFNLDATLANQRPLFESNGYVDGVMTVIGNIEKANDSLKAQLDYARTIIANDQNNSAEEQITQIKKILGS